MIRPSTARIGAKDIGYVRKNEGPEYLTTFKRTNGSRTERAFHDFR
jgi:hypothetical protein